MAGTCEDDFFSDSILQFLREPTGSEFEELMEGAEAFIAEIENEAQHRKEPCLVFEAATPGDLQKFKEKNLNKNTTKSTNTWVNRFELSPPSRSTMALPFSVFLDPSNSLSLIMLSFAPAWRRCLSNAASIVRRLSGLYSLLSDFRTFAKNRSRVPFRSCLGISSSLWGSSRHLLHAKKKMKEDALKYGGRRTALDTRSAWKK